MRRDEMIQKERWRRFEMIGFVCTVYRYGLLNDNISSHRN